MKSDWALLLVVSVLGAFAQLMSVSVFFCVTGFRNWRLFGAALLMLLLSPEPRLVGCFVGFFL